MCTYKFTSELPFSYVRWNISSIHILDLRLAHFYRVLCSDLHHDNPCILLKYAMKCY